MTNLKKNKLGLSLSRKKGFFGPKIEKKFENKVQKLTNFKEKNKLGLSFSRKKGFFGPKIGEKKNENQGQKLTNFQKKIIFAPLYWVVIIFFTLVCLFLLGRHPWNGG